MGGQFSIRCDNSSVSCLQYLKNHVRSKVYFESETLTHSEMLHDFLNVLCQEELTTIDCFPIDSMVTKFVNGY